ncbi:MAG: phage minor capsid protein [Alphaproteobacteria bacterium]
MATDTERATALRKADTISRKVLLADLEKAQGRIERAIVKQAAKGNFATSAVVRDQLYREIGAIHRELGGDVNVWNERMSRDVARQWRKFAIEDVPAGAYQERWQTFSRKHMGDYLAFANPTNAAEIAAVRTMNTRLVGALRNEVTQALRVNAIAGGTRRELRKDMQDRMGRAIAKGWKFTDISGREWKPRTYFSMLARTVPQEVSRAATMDVAQTAGMDVVQVTGGRPSDPPPDPCWPWWDRLLSISGETSGLPTVAEARETGLFHPNCIHGLAPVDPDEMDEAEQDQEAAEERTKTAEAGAERRRKTKQLAKAEKTLEPKKTDTAATVERKRAAATKAATTPQPKAAKPAPTPAKKAAANRDAPTARLEFMAPRERLKIAKAQRLLKQRGYKLGKPVGTLNGQTAYDVVDASGENVIMDTKRIRAILTRGTGNG